MRHIAFVLLLLIFSQSSFAASIKEIKQAMKKATAYMMDSISHQGGFVWSYLPDHSRCWGEMEATESMVWVQSPSTPEVGNVLIDAYKASHDEFYYQMACRVADVLIKGQHTSGGWNYCFDLNGEESLRKWYQTIGQSGWRLEEFQHYYGNATFDDEVTANVAHFFLNIYKLKKDAKYKKVLDKAIGFICDSQYENGGWPQRFPLMYSHPFKGKADYSSFITLNDEVLLENIKFLQECVDSLGMVELKPRIKKAMYLIPKLQQPKPYAGWSDQYTIDLKPAHARSYEPRAVNTGTTMKMIGICRDLFEKTGDSVFIRRLPEAFEFLKSQRLGEDDERKWGQTSRDPDAFLVPRFVNPDNGQPQYVHRRGSNVYNGEYYIDQDISNTISHYSSATWVNLKWLDAPRHINYRRNFFDNTNVDEIISSMTPSGIWLSPLRQISNPYKDAGNPKPSNEVKYATTYVGDEFDTSPFEPETPVIGISTSTYLKNMSKLIHALKEEEKAELFSICNGKGMKMNVTNYGGRILSLVVPNKKKATFDVVLGFDSLSDYSRLKQNFGAIIGRYIGRIRNADGTITSHGGKPGFANRFFDVKSKTDNSITLEYVSPDGESGFTGELTLDVTYTLTDDNSLRIDYEATTSKPTVLNPSNHSFFNLTGFGGNVILDEKLWLAADSVLEYDSNKNVTGKILPVKKTKFDFTKPHKISNDYDNCFKLREHTLDDVVARLYDKKTGLTMEVYTTEPGIQVYTANGHRGNIIGKGGVAYPKNNAICFETMHFHDSPNQPHFPSTSLKPGETFRSTTIYKIK